SETPAIGEKLPKSEPPSRAALGKSLRRRVELADLMNEPWMLAPPAAYPDRGPPTTFGGRGSIFPEQPCLRITMSRVIAPHVTSRRWVRGRRAMDHFAYDSRKPRTCIDIR